MATTSKEINLVQLDQELGGQGLVADLNDPKKKLIKPADNSTVTEAELEVPISIENLTIGDSLEIFPKQAKITYLVSLSNYNKVNPKLFRISADAFDIRNAKNVNLRLNVKQFPPYVQSIRLEPETVEFIIRKNK